MDQNRRARDFKDYVNPLMTSMQCLKRHSVQGMDILDPDPEKNPNFYAHNHVLIPYCSSDLWLGAEFDANDPERCQCGNLSCFGYSPDASRLQFTFRGQTIFKTIFKQLLGDHNMSSAERILLAGSSAGGVGVVNLAQWVRGEMSMQTNLFLLLDSAWFINFQENIYRVFNGTVPSVQQGGGNTDEQRLLDIIAGHASCNDTSLGYPCCISAHCVMTTRDTAGNLAYFPKTGVRTFALGSVYDILLLAPTLAGFQDIQSEDNADEVTDLLVDFVRVAGEYGGEMNFTLAHAADEVGMGLKCVRRWG